jgi:hypothetical protein
MRVNLCAAILGVILLAAPANAAGERVLVFGGQNHEEYLGCISCSETAADSIWNRYSQYGWENGFGKWNSFGKHKNQFSSTSACNEFASKPPILVDAKGAIYGSLSVNAFAARSVCGAVGVEQVCRALRAMCAST